MPIRAIRVLAVLAPLLALGCGGDPGSLPPGEILLQGPETTHFGGPLRLRLFLPEGSGPGRPFWVDDAEATPDGRPLFREAGILDDAGRAALTCNVLEACSAVLDGATGCVTLVADHALYVPDGTDRARSLDGTLEICPIAGAPAARVASLRPTINVQDSAPLTALALRAWVPLDLETLGSLEVTHDGVVLPSRYEGTAFAGRLVLDDPIDPSGTIAVDTTGVLDVLGRPVDTTTVVATTTAVLADLSLDTAPTEGAVAVYGAELATSEGALVATDTGHFPRVRPFLALLALGDPGSATAVEIVGHQVQRYSAEVTARVVRAGGAAGEPTSLPPTSSGTVSATIPAGSGPIWLVLHSDQSLGQPLDLASPDFLTLDSIALVSP